MKQYLSFSEEVLTAKQNNQPIVALESTIISHGMPYPKNVETARLVEKLIRENGAVPATIAIMNGEIKIGLSEEELESLGNRDRKSTRLNSSHVAISYAVFCLKKKKDKVMNHRIAFHDHR